MHDEEDDSGASILTPEQNRDYLAALACERSGEPMPVSAAPVRMKQRIMRPVTTYTAHGQTLTMEQWAEQLGVTENALHDRKRKGWSLDKVFMPRIRAMDGGGSRLSKTSGDRRGEVSARAAEIGVFHP